MHSSSISLLSALNLLVNLSKTQLTGFLSSPSQQPELITVTIINVSSGNVSVLAHNNVFDTAHDSMPFTIKNDRGERLPNGGSHFFYGGLQKGDFLDLTPGSNFTRDFNLTKYVTSAQSEPETFKTFTISLSPRYRGFQDHDGTHDIQSSASARGEFTTTQMRLGDFSRLNLTSISLTSSPLNTTVVIPAAPSKLHRRAGHPPGGIFVGTDACNPTDAAKLNTAILHTSYLAKAGQAASSNFNALPFTYFFKSNLATASTVGTTLAKIDASATKQAGPVIAISCVDVANQCNHPAVSIVWAYSMQKTRVGIPVIVICPAAMQLPFNAVPCTDYTDPAAGRLYPGTVTLGVTVLHEMLHITALTGMSDVVGDFADEAYIAQDCNALVRTAVGNDPKQAARWDSTLHPSCMSYLGGWAWDTGTVGPGAPYTGPACVNQRWTQGNFKSLAVYQGRVIS